MDVIEAVSVSVSATVGIGIEDTAASVSVNTVVIEDMTGIIGTEAVVVLVRPVVVVVAKAEIAAVSVVPAPVLTLEDVQVGTVSVNVSLNASGIVKDVVLVVDVLALEAGTETCDTRHHCVNDEQKEWNPIMREQDVFAVEQRYAFFFLSVCLDNGDVHTARATITVFATHLLALENNSCNLIQAKT